MTWHRVQAPKPDNFALSTGFRCKMLRTTAQQYIPDLQEHWHCYCHSRWDHDGSPHCTAAVAVALLGTAAPDAVTARGQSEWESTRRAVLRWPGACQLQYPQPPRLEVYCHHAANPRCPTPSCPSHHPLNHLLCCCPALCQSLTACESECRAGEPAEGKQQQLLQQRWT